MVGTMNYESLKGHFADAANALAKGLKQSGYIGNTPRKILDFTVDNREYRVIEANPDKNSPAAKLAQQGHEICHVKDVSDGENGRLVGFIDVTDNNKWHPYDNATSKPVEISEIQQALTSAGEKTMGATAGSASRR